MREEDDEDVTIAEWIADKFVRPEWSLPSIEALQKRVAVDKEYALQASKKKLLLYYEKFPYFTTFQFLISGTMDYFTCIQRRR